MEEPFTGFEVIHPPAGSKDFVAAALKAGQTPTEVAAFLGTTFDEVAAILNLSSSSSTREGEVDTKKERSRYKRYSPPMSPIASLECKRYVDGDDDDDGLSIVSSVTNCVKTIASVYSTECSVFTEMHNPIINVYAQQNQSSGANLESTVSDRLPRKQNRFARKILKRLSSLPLVAEVDASVHSELSSPTAIAEQQPKKKRFAKQALKKLSNLRKNSPNGDKNIPSDASTVASTHAHSSMNSSITVSTDDFDEDPPAEDLDELAFQSYLYTTPWDAAKHGDYATLNYIANNKDESDDVWTKEDVSGNVPLYYACVYGGNYGKYGLESVKLMLNVWPKGDVPSDLLKRCLKETENKAVKKLLREKMGKGSGSMKTMRRSSTVLEGTEEITPKSFLEDLGDDGYVEDY